ncbi:MAG: UDP-3-O-(3-hydroxymyristoyl)glucosamine N-acyltransferase [Holophagales bacterium]|nr:UDP-3-O-(3-hydroxymyristoyl)glucosamine N-acyltransferase [Holophagales bacterium]MBK9964278.1 UDP-3-O-(3-hydroxymyristoyl)glucosamine N-acyltransferase [Holophagales bacterium]
MAGLPAATTAAELAEACRGRLVGDGTVVVEGVRSLETAGPRDLSFAADGKAEGPAAASAAGVLLVRSAREFPGRTVIEVPSPSTALAVLLAHAFPRRSARAGTHPTAIVDPEAQVAPGAEVGPYAVVGVGSVVEDGAILEAHTVVGRRCRIGCGAWLHPHVVLYDDVSVGPRAEVHSGAVLGADGFGYAPGPAGLLKIPQVGSVEVGADAEIGANTCVDRATLETTRVGDGTKIDDLVMIGHNCDVGRHVVLCGQVGLAGSTTVGDQAVLGGQTGTIGHVRIGKGARVGGQTGVSSDIPDGGTSFGTPHMPHRQTLRVNAELKRLPETARLVRDLAKAAGRTEMASPAEKAGMTERTTEFASEVKR